MGNVEDWVNQEIFTMNLSVWFNECIERMYSLMNDSFKRTQEYMNLDSFSFFAFLVCCF